MAGRVTGKLKKHAKKQAAAAAAHVLAVLAPYLLPLIAVGAIVGLVVMLAISASNQTNEGYQADKNAEQAQQVQGAYTSGADTSNIAAYLAASQQTGVPWQLFLALEQVDAILPSEGGYVGPLLIDKDILPKGMDGKPSAYESAVLLGEALNSKTLSQLASQAQQPTSTTSSAVPTDASGLQKAQQEATQRWIVNWAAIMTTLPVQNHDFGFMYGVASAAARWLNNQTGQCLTGAGMALPVNVPDVDIDGLSKEQVANAWGIMQGAQKTDVGESGAIIGVMTALTETGLLNYANDGSSTLNVAGTGQGLTDEQRAVAAQSLDYPHQAVGNNLDSMGLFQQRPSAGWGTPAQLMDPSYAAGKFFDTLVEDVPNWQSLDPWMAAQNVQRSAYANGSNYQAQYSKAVRIVRSLASAAPAQNGDLSSGMDANATAVSGEVPGTVSGVTTEPPVTTEATDTAAPTSGASPSSAGDNPPGAENAAAQIAGASSVDPCAAASGGIGNTVVANGPVITIPDDPNVPEEIRGKTIQAPTAAVAKGIAAGFSALGMPYVWGGGTDDGPADEGCSRGGGSKNSCQGIVGFDCSGLTAHVLKVAGYSIPTNSSGQRQNGQSVSWDQGLPGDIIGYPGHVSIYLGEIGGVKYQLEAPDVGLQVRVRTLFRSDFDSTLHRYWTPGSASSDNDPGK